MLKRKKNLFLINNYQVIFILILLKLVGKLIIICVNLLIIKILKLKFNEVVKNSVVENILNKNKVYLMKQKKKFMII